jgi:NAD(P)-dependent dehydrogenase (short-subunit alcohol dehydrogenase family)
VILDVFRLDGKNALVTGSSRGLGAAIAIALAEAGANVALHGRSQSGESSCEVIRKLGRKTFFLAGDVADPAVCSTLVHATAREFGSIDILVNNAAAIRRAPAAKYTNVDWDELIATNLTSVFISPVATCRTTHSTAPRWRQDRQSICHLCCRFREAFCFLLMPLRSEGGHADQSACQ